MRNPAAANSSKILECFPMIGSTALFMKHTRGTVAIAMTNGREVVFGEAFFKLSEPEKNSVVLHEYLHCVLSHPQRAGLMRVEEGEKFCPLGFNIAADALINYTIRKEGNNQNLIKLPDWAIDIDEIRKDLHNLDLIEKDDLKPNETNVEQIYKLLMLAKNMTEAPQETEGDPHGKRKAEAAAQSLEKIKAMFDDEADLMPASGSVDELKDEIRQQTGRNNANSSIYGSDTGNILERISGDIPKAKVPWESAFRTVTAKHLSRDRIRNNRKPSGAMLSHESMGGAKFWEAGRMRTPHPTALIIADTSGSVLMDDYVKFLGELDGMRRRTNARLLFGQADTELREISEVKTSADIKRLHINGRGGTDFIKPLQEAEKLKPDVVIYMTDLDGSFPESCNVPVIWVSINRNKKTPPFGRCFEVR